MQTLEERVLSQLECPVCYKYMSAPIRVCSKGHSCCDGCVQKYSTCICCSYPFLTTRNLVLEALVYEIGINCSKCKWSFTSDIYYKHKCFNMDDKNDENIYKCRVEIIQEDYRKKNCRWYGDIRDIKKHFENVHQNNCFVLDNGRTFKWKLPYEQDQENISVIKGNNNIFLQEVHYEYEKKKLFFAVYNLSENKDKKYKYKIIVNDYKFVGNVFNDYTNIHKLKKTSEMVQIGVEVFNMPEDRVIMWILEIF